MPASGNSGISARAEQNSAFQINGLSAVLIQPDIPFVPAGVVIMLPDSMGPDRREDLYIDALIRAGVQVLSLLPTDDEPPPSPELAAQALISLLQADPSRIAVLGFGAGGLAAAAADYPFAARVLLYPGCASLTDVAPTDTRLLLLHGTDDPSNTPAQCAAASHQLRERGAEVTRVAYLGVGYGWDMPQIGYERATLMPIPGQAGRVLAVPQPGVAEIAASRSTHFILAAFAAAHP